MVSDACLAIEDATLYEFGILTSRMHMDWLRTVGGRLESRYRYSKDIVYNSFVFPTVTGEQREELGGLAQQILDARARRPDDTLADLYDPNVMPAGLAAAHRAVDLHVDRLYRGQPYADSGERVAHLRDLREGLAVLTQ